MKPLFIILLFSFCSTLLAQGYKAPKLKSLKSSPKTTKVKKPSMDDQDSFRVQEESESERNLASDEEMELKWSESYEKEAQKPQKKPESDERIIPWKMIE